MRYLKAVKELMVQRNPDYQGQMAISHVDYVEGGDLDTPASQPLFRLTHIRDVAGDFQDNNQETIRTAKFEVWVTAADFVTTEDMLLRFSKSLRGVDAPATDSFASTGAFEYAGVRLLIPVIEYERYNYGYIHMEGHGGVTTSIFKLSYTDL